MAEIGERFPPGTPTPESGFYECDCPNEHRWSPNYTLVAYMASGA